MVKGCMKTTNPSPDNSAQIDVRGEGNWLTVGFHQSNDELESLPFRAGQSPV
jgi:hypothetical protein